MAISREAGTIVKTKKSLHSLHQSMVTVHVGPTRHPFLIHKGRLCSQSAYFKAAFEGSFAEAETQSLNLEDTEVEVFKTFEEWLYTGVFRCLRSAGDYNFSFIKCWCFGHMIDAQAFEDLALGAVRRGITYVFPGPEPISFAMENTPPGSPLIDLIAKVYIDNLSRKIITTGHTDYPIEFLAHALAIAVDPSIKIETLGKFQDEHEETELTEMIELLEAKKIPMYDSARNRTADFFVKPINLEDDEFILKVAKPKVRFNYESPQAYLFDDGSRVIL